MYHAPFEITLPLYEAGKDDPPGALLIQRDIVGGVTGDKGLFLEMRDRTGAAYGFLTPDDARRLAEHIVSHLGLRVTDRPPNREPEPGDVTRVTVQHPYMAPLDTGEAVRVVAVYADSDEGPIAVVASMANPAERYRVHLHEHLEQMP